jgi:CBS domain-containing protein
MLSGGVKLVSEDNKPAAESITTQPPTGPHEQSSPSQTETEPITLSMTQPIAAAEENKETQIEASDTVRKDEAEAEADMPGVSVTEAPLQPALKAEVQKDDTQAMSKCVTEIMQTDIVWALPDDSVRSVLSKMQQHNSGYVMVGSDGVPEGIVSNSNIAGAISPYLHPAFAKWRRPLDDASLDIKIKWVMSSPVRTMPADATIADAIENIRRFGGRCLPVVDAQGTVQGLVTVLDIIFKIFSVDGDSSQQCRTPQLPTVFI